MDDEYDMLIGNLFKLALDPFVFCCFVYTLVFRYYYKDIGNLAKLMDGPPGGISISVESYKRLHLFVVEKRDVFLQTVAEYAMRHVGVLISYKEEMSEETAQLKRFGRYSVDEAVTSLCDFMVHKISVKHRVRSSYILAQMYAAGYVVLAADIVA